MSNLNETKIKLQLKKRTIHTMKWDGQLILQIFKIFNTKLHNFFWHNRYFPEEYSVVRKGRTQSGGGVFIALKDPFVSVEATEGDTLCEIIWTSKEFVRTSKVFLGIFYLTPSDGIDHINHLFDSLTKIMEKSKGLSNIIYNMRGLVTFQALSGRIM